MKPTLLMLLMVLSTLIAFATDDAGRIVGGVEAVLHEGVVTFTVVHPEAVSSSVKVFDLKSDGLIFDSGPRARTRVTWPAGHDIDGGFRYLVTAWNADGEVVVSQTAANKKQTSISEITFDTVPDNTKFRGPDEIIMEADVQVGDTQAVRLREDYYGHGGGLYLYQEDGVLIHAYSVPEFEGTGNKTYLRGGNDDSYLLWEGYSSATNGTLSVLGVSDFIVDTGSTGDSSVVMPADAVSASEIENEAGVASKFLDTWVDLDPPWTNVLLVTRTITAPTDGFVFATSTVSSDITHSTGIKSGYQSCINTAIVMNFDHSTVQMSSNTPPGDCALPMSVSRIIPVSAGANTILLVCMALLDSDVTIKDRNLNLLFVPTAYGTVSTSE